MGPGLEGPEGGNPSMDLGNPGNGDNDHRVIRAEDPPIGAPRGMDVRLEGSRNHNQHEGSSCARIFSRWNHYH